MERLMKQWAVPLLILLTAAGCTDAPGEDRTGVAADENERYIQVRPSRDGIGKVYMGREISHVMGHLAAGWLERPTREREERTDLLIDRLPLSPNDVVADIGAGTGFFSIPIARRVPAGRVLAVDIQQEMLDIIEERKQNGAPDNIETVLGSITDPNLPAGAVDLILLVDAYHEFSHPYEMGMAMVEALAPGGTLVLIEYRAEDPYVPIKPLHKMSEDQAIKEMQAVGLEHLRTEDVLPQQHFMVFRKPVGIERSDGPSKPRPDRVEVEGRSSEHPKVENST
jgi:ubiquinone/menaquinone biosynthesis C-methylase UbiE